jgi:hypothetical protein
MEPWDQIEQAQQRLRGCVFRVGMAGRLHIGKGRDIVRDPKLLERHVEPFEGDDLRIEYQQSLPELIEQTWSQDARCAELWKSRPTDPLGSLLPYYRERDRLGELFLRFRFRLDSYEILARQPQKPVLQEAQQHFAEAPESPGARALESRLRMPLQGFIALEEEIVNELRLLGGLRAEVVAAYRGHAEEMAISIAGRDPDAIRCAMCGLRKAAERYSHQRGYEFWLYAQHWVEKAARERKTWGLEDGAANP